MKQVTSALLSSEHCNENHGHLYTWSQNRERIQIETCLLNSECHVSTHAVLLTLNCKVCVLSYVLPLVLMPLAHVRGRKGPAGRGVAAVGTWRREARRKGRRTRLDQERDPQPRGKAPAVCAEPAGTGIVCQKTSKWAQRNKHVFWNNYIFTLRSSVTLGASFWKSVSLSRAGVGEESGCSCRAGAQPVWPPWAAPPVEPESAAKRSSKGTSADRQPASPFHHGLLSKPGTEWGFF